MADDGGEQKPFKPEGGVINLVVKDQGGNEVHFKVKMKTKLEKVMKAYCDKKGIELTAIRFLFDGDRVQKENTPEDLAMEDGDVIDCVMEQVGGR